MTYVSHVRPRWTDMDVYGHVNHAKLVTLLEEARIPLLFKGAVEAGLDQLPKGIVVVRLEVAYKAPIVVSGQELRVDIDLTQLRAASFTLAYRVHGGPSPDDPVAVTAETVLAPYDTVELRPRRLSPAESEFLKQGFADA
ncbi:MULTISPECIES: acyl-CoA thioesterase [unclassified Amycolatopsis]|uniref:acyl-CoA thioesterase n=1 Tax=unclassified Amycolatopsis TaxID=2618356 RepID=UPI0028770AB4|nr:MULTISPECIES: thioesterase family protein [unclassified Amycolatopsis]MDS0136231.1 acyl-CoA thioesterase [Amycolatopsis sp. 505]MDS0145746.1 acyl-CoA thioesterase [Amycolatopsis sp. CM201R]